MSGHRVAALVAPMLVPASLWAQDVVRGRVIEVESGQPVREARIVGRVSRALTDAEGRFTLPEARFPDTLRISAVGRVPDTLIVAEASAALLVVRLQRAVVQLPDARAVARRPDAALDSIGRWALPMSEAREIPPAIEADVYRALVAIPGVTFTNPLSARPLVRGYDGSESGFRLDGFELMAPYHISRIFSAIPAEGAEEITVAAAPASAAAGRTTAGTIDVRGRQGRADSSAGGVNMSFISSSAWLGDRGASLDWFTTARMVYWQAAEIAKGITIPYGFQDVYANGVVHRGDRTLGRITVFGSRDRLHADDNPQKPHRMDWTNFLVGSRWTLVDGAHSTLEATASATRYASDVVDIPARAAYVDMRNRFGRVGGGLEWTRRGTHSALTLGGDLGWRLVDNMLRPREPGAFVESDVRVRRPELAAWGEWSRTLGTTDLQLGLRMDAAGGTAALQPRARLGLPLARDWRLGLTAGRTARLYSVVSDPQAEPDIAFYDVWQSAGENGVPIPIVDHATADVEYRRGGLGMRFGAYLSRGHGLAELRPWQDQDAGAVGAYRFGRARTWGVETQLDLVDRARRNTLSLAYVLSGSTRSWDGATWVSWAQERRHLVRLRGQTLLSGHWAFSAAGEVTSGPRLTPIDHIVPGSYVDPRTGGITTVWGGDRYVYGRENSVTTPPVGRLDVAFNYRFRGPWSSRMALGISILNVTFGPALPVITCGLYGCGEGTVVHTTPAGITYRRLLNPPAIPTLTLRAEF